MSNKIQFDKKSKCFIFTDPEDNNKKHKLRGLHSTLRAKFYPVGSCFENLKKWPVAAAAAKGVGKKKTLPMPVIRKAVSNNRGAKRLGKTVDRQMQRLVEAAAGDAVQLRHWCLFKEQKKQQQVIIKPKNPKKRPVQKPHVFAMAAIQCLLDNDWVPVKCQFTVGSIDHGLATDVDVVCRHARDKARPWADIEVKCGYDKTWEANTGQRLNKPLDKLADSDRNKAHLQVSLVCAHAHKNLPCFCRLHAGVCSTRHMKDSTNCPRCLCFECAGHKELNSSHCVQKSVIRCSSWPISWCQYHQTDFSILSLTSPCFCSNSPLFAQYNGTLGESNRSRVRLCACAGQLGITISPVRAIPGELHCRRTQWTRRCA